jgi:hypothetical protein
MKDAEDSIEAKVHKAKSRFSQTGLRQQVRNQLAQ